MTQDYKHPITPPPEEIGDWWIAWDSLDESERPRLEDFIAIKAAQWGADRELEACCDALNEINPHKYWSKRLCAVRRPKPPSLKEQALEALEHILSNSSTDMGASTIRRALEQLDD